MYSKKILRKDRKRAFTLVELLLVLAVLGTMAAVAWPKVNMWAGYVRVRLAAGEVAGALAEARLTAVKYSAKVALRFETADDGAVTMTLYRDTDGDGVLSRDIRRGTDRVEKAQRRLQGFDERIRFGFPYGEAPREISRPSRRITRLRDPIRFNRSDMASFSSLGTATPGTVYLTDGYKVLIAVRVNNRSGMISLWSYDKDDETWRAIG